MKIENPARRLGKFWGKVDRKHVQLIADFVQGPRVLDMGAGYGTTTTFLQAQGMEVTAIDLDDESIRVAKELHPGIDYRKANAEELPFEDATFDTLILRDALHHFIGEADFSKVGPEMMRVLKPGGRVIFFDPNVNFLVKTLRKVSRHDDEECTYEEALRVMHELGLEVEHKSFNTLYSLPLSGGYVGLNFVPQVGFIHRFLLGSERLFERTVQNGLGRRVAWRYLVVGKRPG